MKGKILGCDSSGCVINGENGDRYLFQLADWKGTRPPQARDEVDFVAAGAKATEVYPALTAPAFTAEAIDTEAGRKTLQFLGDRPQVILAAVALFASIFLNFVQVKGVPGVPDWQTTAVGVPNKVGLVRAAMMDGIKSADVALTNMERSSGNGGGSDLVSLGLAMSGKSVAEMRNGIDQAKGMAALSQLVVAIFLIPAGAAAILYFEIKKTRKTLIELCTGVVALLSVGATFYAREAVAGYVNKSLGTGAETFKQAFQIGPGGWLLAACGIGLVATALGYLKRTPGIPG